MENGRDSVAGNQNINLTPEFLSLQYYPYEVRQTIKEVGLSGLDLEHQLILIVWSSYFSMGKVTGILKSLKSKAVGEDSNTLISTVRESSLSSKEVTCSFTRKAMNNFYWLDRMILSGDYRALESGQMRELARLLDRMNSEMFIEMQEEGKVYMGLALVKMQERVARRDAALESMRHFEPYKSESGQPMSEEGRKKLEGVLEELKQIERKEEEYGPNRS